MKNEVLFFKKIFTLLILLSIVSFGFTQPNKQFSKLFSTESSLTFG